MQLQILNALESLGNKQQALKSEIRMLRSLKRRIRLYKTVCHRITELCTFSTDNCIYVESNRSEVKISVAVTNFKLKLPQAGLGTSLHTDSVLWWHFDCALLEAEAHHCILPTREVPKLPNACFATCDWLTKLPQQARFREKLLICKHRPHIMKPTVPT
jgi:hypothetical protein